MGGGEDDVANDVVALHPCAADALATATLGLEGGSRHRLHVLRLGHHDHELFVLDEIFDAHLAGVEHERTHARCGELLLDRRELALDDVAQLLGIIEDAL